MTHSLKGKKSAQTNCSISLDHSAVPLYSCSECGHHKADPLPGDPSMVTVQGSPFDFTSPELSSGNTQVFLMLQ